jgi:hypothetical protein
MRFDVILGALAHAPELVGFLVLGGAHDDRDVLGGIVLRQCAGGLEAVRSRHDHVHQHQVGHDLLGTGDTFVTAFRGGHLVAGAGQELGEDMSLSG